MDDDEQHLKRSPKTGWWVLAYLLSPGLPFVCLRVGRAIGTIECILGVLAGLIAHVGLVSVLAKTNGEPLQIFITLLMGVSIFTVVMWLYLAGQRAGFWSESAKKQWRLAGRFFGALIGIAIALNILAFHLKNSAKQTRAEQAHGEQRLTRSEFK